jgi:hypothetical protein
MVLDKDTSNFVQPFDQTICLSEKKNLQIHELQV